MMLKRFLKILLIVLAILLLLVLIVFLFSGKIANHYLEKKISEKLGVSIQTEKIQFNPLTATATVEDFVLKSSTGEELCSAKKMVADFGSIKSAVSDGLHFQKIYLLEPDVKVKIDREGKLDLGEIMPEVESSGHDKKEKNIPKLSVDNFNIENGRIEFSDQRFGENGFQKTLNPVDLVIKNFSTESSNTKFELTTKAEDQEVLKIKGTLGLQPLIAQARVELINLPPDSYSALFSKNFNGDITNGTISLEGDVDLGDNGTLKTISDAILTLNNGAISIGEGELLQYTKIQVTGFNLDNTEQTLGVNSIETTNLFASIKKNKSGKLNVLSLVPGTVSTESKPPKNASSKGLDDQQKSWNYLIKKISLPGTKIEYIDHTFKSEYRQSLVFSATGENFSNQEIHKSTLDVNGQIEGGGTIKVSLNGALLAGNGEGEINIGQLPVPVLAKPWIGVMEGMKVNQADIGYRGRAKFVNLFSPRPILSVEGETSVTSVSIDLKDKPLLRCQEVMVGEVNYELPSNQFSVSDLSIQSPKFYLNRNADGGFDLFNQSGEQSTDRSRSNSATLFQLNQARISGGEIHFNDQSNPKEFQVSFRDIDLGIEELNWGRKKSAWFAGVGNIDYHAPFEFKGRYDDSVSPLFPNMDLILKNVWAKPISPYAEKYIGRELLGGAFSIKQDIQISPNNFDGEVKFLFDHLKVGKVVDSASAIKAPIGLALFILGKKGKVDESIRFSGNPSNPDFSIWPLAWKSLLNTIIKLAATPIGMVTDIAKGSLGEVGKVALGGLGNNENANIDQWLKFEINSHLLTASSKTKLDALVPFLKENPYQDLRLCLSEAIGELGMSDLCGQRVVAVRKYLVTKHGFRPHRVLGMRPGANKEGEKNLSIDYLHYWLERLDRDKRDDLIPLPKF